MIRDAAKHGDVIVVANSDEWLMRKKGFVFMPFEERRDILKEIKGVIIVAAVDDSDGTVCDALRKIRPDYFANGGDRGKEQHTGTRCLRRTWHRNALGCWWRLQAKLFI